jgi:plasmid stabilization system protein ParE
LGKKFFSSLDQRLNDLSRMPQMGSISYDDIHCIATKVFQYLIHYFINTKEREIIVLRIWHTKQKPLDQ